MDDDDPLRKNSDLAYAAQVVHATCCLAGSASYLADLREDLRDNGIIRAVRDHDTPTLFDWLIRTLSFQGISDTVAAGYIAEHGSVRWSEIADALSARPSCPKLNGYWRFYDCRYHKGSHKCSELAHIEACPLPRHPLRKTVADIPSYARKLSCTLREQPASHGGRASVNFFE
jgi:hypothetical protein